MSDLVVPVPAIEDAARAAAVLVDDVQGIDVATAVAEVGAALPGSRSALAAEAAALQWRATFGDVAADLHAYRHNLEVSVLVHRAHERAFTRLMEAAAAPESMIRQAMG